MHTDTLPLSTRSRAPRSGRPRPARPQLQMASAGLTDRGRVRLTNEDRFLIRTFSDDAGVELGHLFAVADGAGGACAGETASTLALASIDQTWFQPLHLFRADGDRVASELRALFGLADRRLAEEIERRPALTGMATALTAALCLGHRLFVGHVGESRCYLLRGDALRQLTTDQTLPADLHVEVREHELHPGDTVLVCSDGLTRMAAEGSIRSILLSAAHPADACERLVALANEMGGRDNVTVVVARCALAP